MKKIGIIGGLGALASCDLYQKIISLTPANKDQDHIPLIIDSNSQIPDRTSFIMGESSIDPTLHFIQSAKNLKNCGCDDIAIACNTAHFFAEAIEKEVDVKILHIAKIAINAVKKEFPNAKKIAIIGTTGTKKAGIYDKILKQNSYEIVEFDERTTKDIMACIYDGVKAGKTKEYIDLFNDIIKRIDADVFIAACTEIPMLLPYLKSDVKFIDATLELARFIVSYSKGEVEFNS